jgi:hypothetical protein
MEYAWCPWSAGRDDEALVHSRRALESSGGRVRLIHRPHRFARSMRRVSGLCASTMVRMSFRRPRNTRIAEPTKKRSARVR